MKEEITNPVLQTWISLNEFLRTANEAECWKLLAEEQNGRKRSEILRRIHCRLNRVRAVRERTMLETLGKNNDETTKAGHD